MSAIGGRLQMALDRAMSWRRRELSNTYLRIPDGAEERYYCRKAILLLYAHTEGFVKAGATSYLDAVRAAAIAPPDLSDHFLGLSVRSHIAALAQAERYDALGRFVRSSLVGNPPLRIPSKGVVKTHSNLSSERFRRIVLSIGLSADRYNPLLLNDLDRLKRLRNGIAHGEGIPVDAATYRELHHRIVDLLDEFKDHLLEAAEADECLHP